MRILNTGLILLILSLPVFGQNVLPTKDAAFGQVAAGPTIESRITVTNRGPFTYTGKLMFRTGDGLVWNPLVDGTRLTAGEFSVQIPMDRTLTIRITDSLLSSGAAILVADDLIFDNFVEANLTYYILKGGKITDSVGVLPSRELYLSSIPFEDFFSIALALANGDLTGTLTAEVRLDLISASAEVVESVYVDLPPMGHQARFLSELFQDVQLTGGKVEIYSRVPFFGTALTLVSGELSTLPLDPSPIGYNVRMIAQDGTVFDGDMVLQLDGFFVRGLLTIAFVDGQQVTEQMRQYVSGWLVDGVLRLAFEGQDFGFYDESLLLRFEHPDFVPDLEIVSGSWVMVFLSDRSSLTGTYEFTRATP